MPQFKALQRPLRACKARGAVGRCPARLAAPASAAWFLNCATIQSAAALGFRVRPEVLAVEELWLRRPLPGHAPEKNPAGPGFKIGKQ